MIFNYKLQIEISFQLQIPIISFIIHLTFTLKEYMGWKMAYRLERPEEEEYAGILPRLQRKADALAALLIEAKRGKRATTIAAALALRKSKAAAYGKRSRLLSKAGIPGAGAV